MQLKCPANYYFKIGRKWLELPALHFSLLPACLFTPMLTGINLIAKQNMWSKNVYVIHVMGDFDSCIYE
jgi:hypothetical protein